MKKLYARFTQIVYFVGYPFFALVLHNTRRVRVLICSRDAVVLVRTSVGRQEWSLPGGGIEKEEADDHAAIREVREETGLRLTKTSSNQSVRNKQKFIRIEPGQRCNLFSTKQMFQLCRH